MKVSKKNSKSVFAFGLLASQFALLSSHVAFADQLESQVRQMADSNTAQQIDDAVRAGMIDLVPQNRGNGGPSNNSVIAADAALTDRDFDRAISAYSDRIQTKFRKPYVRAHKQWAPSLFFGLGPERIVLKDKLEFFSMYNEPMSEEMVACINKQLAEFVKVPGGLDSALKARNAAIYFDFLNLDVRGRMAEVVKWQTISSAGVDQTDVSLADKFKEMGLDSKKLLEKLQVDQNGGWGNWVAGTDEQGRNSLHVVTYIDLENNCHFTRAADLLKPLNEELKAKADAAKSRENKLNDLNDILGSKNKVGENSSGAGQETKVTHDVSKASQTESSNSSQSAVPAETSASAAN